MAFGDAQVGHQKGNRLGLHDPATVGMDTELTGWNLVLAQARAVMRIEFCNL